MNEVREALIKGIENPPRDYSLEQWHIITEFASYVANEGWKKNEQTRTEEGAGFRK